MADPEAGGAAHQLRLWLSENAPLPETHGVTLTPKRPRIDTSGLADVFPYYAGFSFDWAYRILHEEIDLKANCATVLDPWNGSGTTTLAAQCNKYYAIGADRNPVANIVAQLKVSIRQAAELTPAPPAPVTEGALQPNDPLLFWFTARTAERIRIWTLSLLQADKRLSALGFVSLFRVVRSITGRFDGSNPTWVRRPRHDDSRVDVEPIDIDSMIIAEQNRIIARLREHIYPESPASILNASATALPIATASINAILTSPPYLTRIDYAIAYSRELAVLGIDAFGDRQFREQLMGTTLIRDRSVAEELPYGSVATNLVDRISAHSSKASSGYYRKQVLQYLDDLTKSFDEISRVASDGAVLILVVQDSYYKDIPVNLGSICVDEACRRGWSLDSLKPFEVSRSITQLNKAAQAYPKGKVSETVINMRRSPRGREASE